MFWWSCFGDNSDRFDRYDDYSEYREHSDSRKHSTPVYTTFINVCIYTYKAWLLRPLIKLDLEQRRHPIGHFFALERSSEKRIDFRFIEYNKNNKQENRTMASSGDDPPCLFDKIKDSICPEFMNFDNQNPISLSNDGRFFQEEGSGMFISDTIVTSFDLLVFIEFVLWQTTSNTRTFHQM